MPDLTSDELQAIDFACMVLLEHARRGRKHLNDAAADGDEGVVDWYQQAVEHVDAARVTLRALLAKHKEKSDANQ